MSNNPVLEQFLDSDINRCQAFLQNPTIDTNSGYTIYKEITSRYDNLIKDFGLGLYNYYPEYHFYDSELDFKSLVHNLNSLLQKMIMYRAVNFGNKSNSTSTPKNSIIKSNKVFIVHGHDDALKIEVARTLEKAGLNAIILHEQANSGKTIIEKIEHYSDVSYAVVLYTECDVGYDKNTPEKPNFRARQNVVFEHGYLIGKLGRNNVCALVKGEVELPGDISGIVYTNYDSAGAWKVDLFKNIKGAGLSVDMNTAL